MIVVAVMLFAGTATGNAWRGRGAILERTAGLAAYVLAVNPVAHAATIHHELKATVVLLIALAGGAAYTWRAVRNR